MMNRIISKYNKVVYEELTEAIDQFTIQIKEKLPNEFHDVLERFCKEYKSYTVEHLISGNNTTCNGNNQYLENESTENKGKSYTSVKNSSNVPFNDVTNKNNHDCVDKDKDKDKDEDMKLLSDFVKIFYQEKEFLEYILNEYGTKLPCNRFAIGNSIEVLCGETLSNCGYVVELKQNAKRIDVFLKDYGNLSIKFSSTGDITLHNSNSCINKDEKLIDTLLITTSKIYLLLNNRLVDYDIDLKNYLVNTGDSLKLKRSILTKLAEVKYPYVVNFHIHYDKENCKNRPTHESFLTTARSEFNAKKNPTLVNNQNLCNISDDLLIQECQRRWTYVYFSN